MVGFFGAMELAVRRLMSGLVLVGLVAALAGCGPAGEQAEAPTQGSEGAAEQAAGEMGADEEAAEVAGEATVVSVWAHHGRELENEAMEQIVAAFNAAHEGEIRAEITFFPDRQYADRVSIASASGNLPDVLEVDGPFVGPWAAEGMLQPIEDLVPAGMLDDFLPSIVLQGTYDGELYTLGAFESALVVYYNLDMIEAAGLEPPQHAGEAWTWDEFVAALEAVREHADVPLSLHMDEQGDEWFTYAFSPLIWSNGGKLINTDTGQAMGVLNSAENVEALTRWQNLFDAGLAESSSPNPNPFATGAAAFDWTGHWMLPSFQETEGLRFSAMPLPQMGEQMAFASGSWCWGMSSKARDREATWAFLQWVVDSEEGIKPMVEANGAIPARRSAFEYFPQYEEMPWRLFREQLETAAHPRPRTAVYLTLTSEFARALRDIALDANVATRLEDAARTVQRALDRRQQMVEMAE